MTRTLIAPVVTEKTADAAGGGRYAFEVKGKATKIDVRRAVEKAYGVHVTKVSTQNVRGKVVRFGRTMGKRSSWKKAIVSLKPGERLDIYEASAK
ncbi:MAG: 50S ribosomal protein L23 [bacterium]